MTAPSTTTAAPAPLTPDQIKSIIIGLMMAMLLAALDQTIVATALPTIGHDLGDPADLPWTVTSYLLASTAVTPLYGKFSDIHGRRISLLIAIVVFVIGSLGCALAPSVVLLAVGRAVQGLGGGGLISLAQTILGDILSPRERARYQVYIAGVFALSSLAGPLLGGFFAQHLHWSLIFWINLPIGFAAYLMTNGNLRLLPRHEKPHRLDYLGAALLVVATTCLLLGLSWGGVRYGWTSPIILSLMGASALVWLLFVMRLRSATDPLIPLSVLGDQVVATATLAACFAMGTFIGLAIYLPIYMQGVLGFTASQSGVALVPLMIGTVTGATVSGRSMIHFKHYKRLPIAAMVVAVLACAVLAFDARAVPLVVLEGQLFLISVGLGTILPLSTILIQNTVDPHQLGTATATMNFFRSLGGALIVALFGTIVVGGAAQGSTLDVHGLRSAADIEQLAQTFHFVFVAADAGLLAALFWLVVLEQRPLRDRNAARPPAEDPALVIGE